MSVIAGCDAYFKSELRRSYFNLPMLLRVSRALAQISCFSSLKIIPRRTPSLCTRWKPYIQNFCCCISLHAKGEPIVRKCRPMTWRCRFDSKDQQWPRSCSSTECHWL